MKWQSKMAEQDDRARWQSQTGQQCKKEAQDSMGRWQGVVMGGEGEEVLHDRGSKMCGVKVRIDQGPFLEC